MSFKDNNPKYGNQPLLEKKPRNTEGAVVNAATNNRKIILSSNTPIYKYDVTINYVYAKVDGQEVVVEMSKSKHVGAEKNNDKARCKKIYMLAVNKYPELRKSGPFFYDRQASLYSLSMLKDVCNMNFIVNDVSVRPNFKRAEFKLAQVIQSFQSTSNDIGKLCNAFPKKVDKTLFEALNTIVSGPAFEKANVVTVGNCVHYLYDHSHTSLPQLSSQEGGKKLVKTFQGSPREDKSASLYITTGRNQNLPAECFRICSNQPVRNEQMIGTKHADMMKMSAVKPDVRKKITETVARKVGIASNTINGFIKIGEPKQVTGIILGKPEMVFGANKKVQWNDPNMRRAPTDFVAAGAYALPAELTNWEIVFVKSEILNDTAPFLVKEMQKSGMSVSYPMTTVIQNEKLSEVFAAAKKANRQLLFFVTKSRCNYHQEIKALGQEFGVLTQEIRYETAQKLSHQVQTRKNIVDQINMKLGGINFIANTKSFSDKRLIVGFETSSRGETGPGASICVGYSANMLAHPHQFTGDYVFVKNQSDIYGPMIKNAMIKIIKTVTVKRCKPAEIFIYFSGVTEKQFRLINEAYVDAVKSACESFSSGEGKERVNYHPHISIIAASKTHNERLYKAEPREVCNLESGTVADYTIVSPFWNQFYLSSSVVRQGTAKATKYTVVFSTNRSLSMKEFEELTNDLCYEHQIVSHPIAMPIPLHLAGLCSTRGTKNLAFRCPVSDIASDELACKNKKFF